VSRYWAVFPAAGRGNRVGADRPKQYLEIAGRPLIEYALGTVLNLPSLSGAVVAVAADDAYWGDTALAGDSRLTTVHGGDERFLSVLAGLEALDGRAADQDWVLVHDVARPCLSAAGLCRLVSELDEDPVGGLLAIAVADTLKSSGDGIRIDATVERCGLWRAQTPQQFRYGLLRRALESARNQGIVVTDEAQAIELLGLTPRLVAGEERNIKVTRPEDLALAAYYLQEQA